MRSLHAKSAEMRSFGLNRLHTRYMHLLHTKSAKMRVFGLNRLRACYMRSLQRIEYYIIIKLEY